MHRPVSIPVPVDGKRSYAKGWFEGPGLGPIRRILENVASPRYDGCKAHRIIPLFGSPAILAQGPNPYISETLALLYKSALTPPTRALSAPAPPPLPLRSSLLAAAAAAADASDPSPRWYASSSLHPSFRALRLLVLAATRCTYGLGCIEYCREWSMVSFFFLQAS